MCGIFAYKGEKAASDLLIHGLVNLEYRGYDSAGMCCINNAGELYIEKAVGKVSNLQNKVENDNKNLEGYNLGIAHTRWATHGGVTIENTHPHHSQNGRFHVVHNGIIENFISLKKELEAKYSFYSDTDSEVVAKLIEEEFETDLLTTVKKVVNKIEGAYGLAVIDTQNPDEIVGIKLGSPLVLGIKDETNFFISSDPNALSGVADKFIAIDDHEIIHISGDSYKILNAEKEIEREAEDINHEDTEYSKGNYEHFMLKEIHEMPQTFENSIRGKINFNTHDIYSPTLEETYSDNIERIAIIGAGTSNFAGQIGANLFEDLSGIETHTYVSAEFKYKKQFINKNTLYIFISQSGETADTVDCLKLVKAKGGKTFGIVNVVGSTIARLSDTGLYTHSGREVGVASSKAFVGNIGILITMALYFGNKRNLDYSKFREIISELSKLKTDMENVFNYDEKFKQVAKKYKDYSNMFFVGRNNLYPMANEGSLKFKEITYIHTESYPSGELKHGSLSLVDEDFPTILINPKGRFYDKNISTLKEVKARKGKVIGFITENDPNKDLYDDYIEIPETIEELAPFTLSIALFMFAYETAYLLGTDIDKPRNLAKSVTVE